MVELDYKDRSGIQNRLVVEAELKEWFYDPEEMASEALSIVAMPEAIKEFVTI